MAIQNVRPSIDMPPAGPLGGALEPTVQIDKPSKAVAVVPPAPLPARPTAVALPIVLTASGTWGASIAAAAALGGTTPALVAFGAGVAASAVAYGKSVFFESTKSKFPVSAVASHMTGTDELAKHLRMGLEKSNAKTLRVSKLREYVLAATTIPGDVCATILAHMPRGTSWGLERPRSMAYQTVLTDLGLSSWGCSAFETVDIDAALVALSKVASVTPEQRAALVKDGVAIVSKFSNRAERTDKFKNELTAAVRELAARAPAA